MSVYVELVKISKINPENIKKENKNVWPNMMYRYVPYKHLPS